MAAAIIQLQGTIADLIGLGIPEEECIAFLGIHPYRVPIFSKSGIMNIIPGSAHGRKRSSCSIQRGRLNICSSRSTCVLQSLGSGSSPNVNTESLETACATV